MVRLNTRFWIHDKGIYMKKRLRLVFVFLTLHMFVFPFGIYQLFDKIVMVNHLHPYSPNVALSASTKNIHFTSVDQSDSWFNIPKIESSFQNRFPRQSHVCMFVKKILFCFLLCLWGTHKLHLNGNWNRLTC